MNKFLIILMAFLCGCHAKHHKKIEEKPLTPQEMACKVLSNRYNYLTNEAIYSTVKEMKKKYRLEIASFGSGKNEEGDTLSLHFTTNKNLDLDKGNKLLVYATENFLYNLSKYDSIMREMYGYSFDYKNVEVMISKINCKQTLFLPEISHLYVDNGVVQYCTIENEKIRYVLTEPYEKVYKDVNGKDRSENIKKNEQLIIEEKDPNVLLEMKLNRLVYQIYLEIRQELKNLGQVEIQQWGKDFDINKERYFSLHLWSKKFLDKNETRKLIVDVAEICLKRFKEHREEFKDIPLTDYNIKNLYLTIYNKYPKNKDAEFLGATDLNEGKIKYVFWKNESHRFDPLESYEDAYKIVFGKERISD